MERLVGAHTLPVDFHVKVTATANSPLIPSDFLSFPLNCLLVSACVSDGRHFEVFVQTGGSCGSGRSLPGEPYPFGSGGYCHRRAAQTAVRGRGTGTLGRGALRFLVSHAESSITRRWLV